MVVPKLDFSKLTSDASPSASGGAQQSSGPLLLPAPGDGPDSASSDEHQWGGGGQQQALVPADDSHFYVYKTMQPQVGTSTTAQAPPMLHMHLPCDCMHVAAGSMRACNSKHST